MLLRLSFILCWLFVSVAPTAQAQPALNEPERAKQIADLMIDRDDGRSAYREVLLITCKYAMQGGRRSCTSRPITKRIETLTLDVGDDLEDTIGLAIINDPPSEKNMAFLQHDYDEEGRESDQWMYFPTLKKLKRIISQNENSPKTGSVFGSEISYEDIEKMHLSDYLYSHEGVETLDDRTCDRIAAFPTKSHAPKTSYGKEVFWIDRETHIPLKRELYDKGNGLVKTFFCRDIVRSGGAWMFKARIVVNHESRHMTLEKTSKLAVNIPLEEEMVGLRSVKDASYRESGLREIRTQAVK